MKIFPISHKTFESIDKKFTRISYHLIRISSSPKMSKRTWTWNNCLFSWAFLGSFQFRSLIVLHLLNRYPRINRESLLPIAKTMNLSAELEGWVAHLWWNRLGQTCCSSLKAEGMDLCRDHTKKSLRCLALSALCNLNIEKKNHEGLLWVTGIKWKVSSCVHNFWPSLLLSGVDLRRMFLHMIGKSVRATRKRVRVCVGTTNGVFSKKTKSAVCYFRPILIWFPFPLDTKEHPWRFQWVFTGNGSCIVFCLSENICSTVWNMKHSLVLCCGETRDGTSFVAWFCPCDAWQCGLIVVHAASVQTRTTVQWWFVTFCCES